MAGAPPAFDSFPDVSGGGGERAQQLQQRAPRRRDDPEWRRERERERSRSKGGDNSGSSHRDAPRKKPRRGDSGGADATKSGSSNSSKNHRSKNSQTMQDPYATFEQATQRRSKPAESSSARHSSNTVASIIDFRPPKLTVDDKRLFYTSSFAHRDMLTLDCPELSTIPRYRRSGGGRVLGLDRDIRISVKVKHGSRDVVLPSANASRSLRSYKTRMPERESNVRRVVPSRTAMQTDVDYVPLVSHRKKEKQREKHQRGFLTFDVDYRGVQGPAKSSTVDEDVRASSSEESDGDSDEVDVFKARHDDTVKKRIEWDRHLREHPQDVQGWLDYAHFQKDVVLNEKVDYSRKALQSVVLDMQYQVLNKALSHQPRNLDLVVKKLDCGAKGSREGMAKEFRTALHNHKGQPGVDKIWKAYIDYVQCHASIEVPGDLFPNDHDRMCAFEIVSKTYEEALADLNALATSDDCLVEVLTRYCSYLLSAGYTERVYSLYQALLELNFRGMEVDQLAMSWDDPRYRRVGGEQLDDDDERAVYELEYPGQPTYKLREWYKYERDNDNGDNAFPVAGELNDSTDPFRSAIWEVDVLPFLFVLRSVSSKMRLVDSMLGVFGIGVAAGGLSTNETLLHDPLLQVEKAAQGHHALQPQYVNTLFPLSEVSPVVENEHSEHLHRIVDDLGILHLQMLLHRGDNAKLKSILASHADKKYLYDIYARIQYARGKVDSARKVYRECIKGLSGEEEHTHMRISFCYSWSLMEFVSGNLTASLNVLCDGLGAGEGAAIDLAKEQTTISILKARKAWSAHAASSPTASFEVVSCRALLEYLASKSVDKAVSVYEASLEQTVRPSYNHEVLLTELVGFVATVGKLRDADRSVQLPSVDTVKRIIDAACTLYPHNAFFRQSRLLNIGRYGGSRQLFADEVSEDAYAATYIQTVEEIIRKGKSSNANYINKARNVLVTGIQSQHAKHAESLWKHFYHLEMHEAKDEKAAKKMLLTSLAFCPWSKTLHMLLFKLSKGGDDSELLQVLTLMDKYGMRLRIDPETYLKRAVEAVVRGEEKEKAEAVEEASEDSDEEMFM